MVDGVDGRDSTRYSQQPDPHGTRRSRHHAYLTTDPGNLIDAYWRAFLDIRSGAKGKIIRDPGRRKG
jgi:hypothetical protein